jgi:all-trans-8'-apo-beta-carotenal 15,15'-oxygenase
MMHRRHLLQALAALFGGAGLSAPASARPAPAGDFAAAVAKQPLLTPFKGVTDATGDFFTERLSTRGRWPAALAGRFYRNGPALFERNGERYHHWFDGDGMVQQFTLAGGRISHRGRLVRTAKLETEARAGRFRLNTFGTAIPDAAPGTGPDSFNTANTNALEHAGRVLAMWEGGSAYGLDPKDLSTQGPVVWRDDLQQVPFSAHPKLDSQGNLWNIGTFGPRIVVWHIDTNGSLVRVQVGDLPYAGGMVHDMAVTQRYLVVPLPPVQLNFSAAVGDGPRRFALQAGQPLRVLVMEKADITQQRVFELPPQAVFHVGNAHETADGQVVLSYVGAPDAWFLDVGAVALMKGQTATGGASSTHIARLDMATGRASTQSLGDTVEFPRIDPRRIGLPARWLLSAASWTPAHRNGNAMLHGLQLRDTQGGAVRRFDYGAHVVAEEHILVPKPGGRGELDAWLLGTTFDSRAQATELNLLDAARIEDGPIAQATLPRVLPLGFHGNFTPA